MLCLARGRPVYLEAIDLPRVTQSNILAKWIGSEAPAGIDPLVYGSGLNIDTDTGTDCAFVAFCADEADVNPTFG